MRTIVIGGGIVGSCIAWFLAPDREVVVIERDPAYRFASTTLSAASIRVQFSLPLNVAMSQFGAAFMEPMAEEIGLHRGAYLTLAGPRGVDVLRENLRVQTEQGAQVAWLDPGAMAARFPWLNTDDLAAGALGLAGEGWFDAYALLRRVRAEAIARGARYVADETVGIGLAGDRVTGVRLAGGETVGGDVVVNAAGAWAGRVAALAGIDLPVGPRKRTAFVLRAPLAGAGMPLVFDTTGAWIRPEGDGFIAGISPDADPDAAGDFDPDMDLLEAKLWPALAHRIPAFEQLRVMRAWAGHYDMCLLDHNALIGRHPVLENFIIAAGFSGHGVQHGPATGRAVAELVTLGRYKSLDLTPFGYERIRDGRAMPESAIY